MFYTNYTPLLYFPEVADKTLNWYCGDDLENYNKHNKKGWDYYDSADRLKYKFNSQGYRTKELTDVKDDYMLVFGCSYTEGVGLYQEEIWCEKIAKLYDLDVINLAKAGTGPDIVALNNQLFVKNKFKLPKCVVIQWPNSTRKSFAYIENKLFPNTLRLEDRNINWVNVLDEPADTYEMRDTQWYFNRWAVERGQYNYENLYHLHSVNNVWNSLNIPILHWTWDGDFKLKFDKDLVTKVKTKMTGRARDMAHDGPSIHDQVVEQIKDKIKCMISL